MSVCPPEDVLHRLLAEALPDAEREALENHLSGCGGCQQRLEELTLSAGTPRQLPLSPGSEDSQAFLDQVEFLGRLHLAGFGPRAGSGTAPPTERVDKAAEPLTATPPTTGPEAPVDTGTHARAGLAIPGYTGLAELGRGGMSVVYRARQLSLDRPVALKMILSGALASAEERALFRAEAEAIARLRHPHIVQIYEVGEANGLPYLCLEYVDGGSLAERLRGVPQPPAEAARFVASLALAVQHAHAHGVVHRDLKPANVLLCAKSESSSPTVAMPPHPAAKAIDIAPQTISEGAFRLAAFEPKVTDFGLAKRLDHDRTLLGPGKVAGTPGYMAPEQATGAATEVGPRADVYALGAVLYELLTGRPPFQGEGTYDTLLQVVHQEPVPPRALQPRVPRDLETITLKCLAKEPRRRYADARALADDLQRFVNGQPIAARPAGLVERALKWARRHPTVAALLAAVLVVAAVGFTGIWWQWGRAEQRAAAETRARKDEQTARLQEEAARREVEKLSAGILLDQGLALCDRGAIGSGLLHLLRGLEMAGQARDPELEEAARLNLAAWRPHHLRPRFVAAHKGWIWSAVWSADEGTVLTASKDHTVRLWDAASGEERGKPLRHPEAVWSAVFGPQGTVLTGSGANDGRAVGEARLWDLASGKLLLTLPHPSRVDTVAFRPTAADRFLTVCPHLARLYATLDRQLLATLTHPGALIRVGLFSPDGDWIATLGTDGSVRLWDAATGALRRALAGQRAEILAAAFSPDSSTLLTGSAGSEAMLWDVASGKAMGRPMSHNGPVRAVAFSPDGRRLATATEVMIIDPSARAWADGGGEVRLWDPATGAPLSVPLPHPKAAVALAFSPDGQFLLTGSLDHNARLFVCATGARFGNLLDVGGTPRALVFARDGRSVLTASAGSTLRVWDMPAGLTPLRSFPHGGDVPSLAFSADGRTLLTGCEDGRARLWDTLRTRPARISIDHGDAVQVVAFQPDGAAVLTAGGKRAARWDTGSGKLLGAHPLQKEKVASAVFLTGGKAVLVGGRDGTLRQWDVRTGEPVGPPRRPFKTIYFLAARPDELTTVVEWDNRNAALWDPRTGRTVRTFDCPAPGGLCLSSPDGHKVLTAGRDGPRLQLWDTATGKPQGPPLSHPRQGINAAAFSPDGRTLASAGEDATARLWHLPSRKPVGPSLRHSSRVKSVAFDASGRFLATGEKYAANLWEVPHPLSGTLEEIRLALEIQLGVEMDADGIVRELSPDAVRQRRTRLATLAGPTSK